MKRILPVIVISQFFCTSLWFAGNAVIGDIAKQIHVAQSFLAYLTSAVQLGFISGTLLFAILSISDRFSPVKVFFCCAIIAGVINLGVVMPNINASLLLALRMGAGFFLAGIYPVGMKIASDHYQHGLGKSLGFLVGALVLGTAFPHFLKSVTGDLPWRYVIYGTSLLSVIGGTAMMLFVPDGPFRKQGQKLRVSGFLSGFKNKEFRAAAFGYFGHQWELYAFWVFVPVILSNYKGNNTVANFSTSLVSFFIIAIGSMSCVISGLLSQRFGPKRIAFTALTISCACCVISPLLLLCKYPALLIAFLLIWGITVVADSPLFSTLIAQNAPAETKGTSLTIVNCIGFAITIVSIQLINAIRTPSNAVYIYTLLAAGPMLGLLALRDKK